MSNRLQPTRHPDTSDDCPRDPRAVRDSPCSGSTIQPSRPLILGAVGTSGPPVAELQARECPDAHADPSAPSVNTKTSQPLILRTTPHRLRASCPNTTQTLLVAAEPRVQWNIAAQLTTRLPSVLDASTSLLVTHTGRNVMPNSSPSATPRPMERNTVPVFGPSQSRANGAPSVQRRPNAVPRLRHNDGTTSARLRKAQPQRNLVATVTQPRHSATHNCDITQPQPRHTPTQRHRDHHAVQCTTQPRRNLRHGVTTTQPPQPQPGTAQDVNTTPNPGSTVWGWLLGPATSGMPEKSGFGRRWPVRDPGDT